MLKKLTSLLLAALFLTVPTGCGQKDTSADVPSKTAAPGVTGPSAPGQTAAPGVTEPATSAEDNELDVEAYHDLMKEKIIETLNSSANSTIYNRTLDSQDEFDSIEFYDFYFIDKNQERNGNSNFVVRYTMNYDELSPRTSIISLRYNLPEDMLYEVYRAYSQYTDTLPELMDYLYENQDQIEENGYDFNQALGDSHKKDKEGNFLFYDAETFRYYMTETAEGE